MPMQSEIEHENILVNWKPRPGWSLGLGRQHFRQDSVYNGIAQRATLNQVTGSAHFAGATVTGGWLISQAGRSPNVSSYFSVKDELLPWLQSELYLLNVWQPTLARTNTPVLLLRETMSTQLSLLQVISHERGRTSVSFGGTLAAGLSSFSLDYQLAHSPYLTADPFVHSMGVNARLHLFGMALSLGSFVTPDGRMHYSGQGSTFLYRGTNTSGPSRGDGPRRFDRFMIAGRVVDEDGNPVEGAALDVGGETVYTNSQGRFFLRRPSSQKLPLRVVLEDFLLPGLFEVQSAPAEVVAVPEGSGSPVVVVLRRAGQPRND
jgi:hypothetical protein